MPKLYFRHGVVSSAKTLNLLAVAHTYRVQGKSVVIMKPALDSRFGAGNVTSRAGLSQKADYLISSDTNILELPLLEDQRRIIHCILIDEVQFLEPSHIDQLRLATIIWNVPVICYGLRTDFRSNLFPGSKRLMELADNIDEISTTCFYCNAKAILNLKHVNGVANVNGPSVQLGAEEKYYPTCFECYRSSLNKANQSPVSVWTMESDINDARSPLSFENTTYDSPGSRTSSNCSDSNDNDSNSNSSSSNDYSDNNSMKSDDINTLLYSSTTPGTPNSVGTTDIETDYGLSIDVGMKKDFSPSEQ